MENSLLVKLTLVFVVLWICGWAYFLVNDSESLSIPLTLSAGVGAGMMILFAHKLKRKAEKELN